MFETAHVVIRRIKCRDAVPVVPSITRRAKYAGMMPAHNATTALVATSATGSTTVLGTKATFGVAMSARVYSVAAASIGTVAECSWVWEIHRDVPLQGRNCLVTFIYRASICVL